MKTLILTSILIFAISLHSVHGSSGKSSGGSGEGSSGSGNNGRKNKREMMELRVYNNRLVFGPPVNRGEASSSTQNRDNAPPENFVFPEGSRLYILVRPHHVLSGPLEYASHDPEDPREWAYVILEERHQYIAYLRPQREQKKTEDDDNVYHAMKSIWKKAPLPEFPCFITRPGMTGVYANIQPFNIDDKLIGKPRVYFIGPATGKFHTMGQIHDAGAFHPFWARE